MDTRKALVVKFLREILTITVSAPRTNVSHRYPKRRDKSKNKFSVR